MPRKRKVGYVHIVGYPGGGCCYFRFTGFKVARKAAIDEHPGDERTNLHVMHDDEIRDRFGVQLCNAVRVIRAHTSCGKQILFSRDGIYVEGCYRTGGFLTSVLKAFKYAYNLESINWESSASMAA